MTTTTENNYNIEEERKNVLKEMLLWLDHDPVYVYTLNAFAHQEGWITDDEANNIKETLDNHYKDWNKAKQTRNKYMMDVFKKIGFGKTKVLWNLIEQFPKYIIGNPEECTFVAHDDTVIKQLNISSKIYYDTINELVKLDYIEKKLNKKINRMTYKINFMKIKNESDNSDLIQEE